MNRLFLDRPPGTGAWWHEAMVTAMERANLEPVVIEDLVKFGEDRGYDRERTDP